MRARTHALEKLAVFMAERADVSRLDARRRIEERLRELLAGNVDEAAPRSGGGVPVERSDVTEEIVRLRSHLRGCAICSRRTMRSASVSTSCSRKCNAR